MKIKTALSILLLMTGLCGGGNLFSQSTGGDCSSGLLNPESTAFDAAHNRYLVSCFGANAIVAIDAKTKAQSIFAEGMTKPLGNCISKGVLYVSTREGLKGYDLQSAGEVLSVAIPCIQHLDGMTADDNGILYVIDTGGKLFRVDPAGGAFTCVLDSGLVQSVQDCIFDRQNNRLLAVGWSPQSPVQAIDLATWDISPVTRTDFGYFDGITTDGNGHFFVASHENGGMILMFDRNFEGYEIIATGFEEPAGIDYNSRDHLLTVPNFAGNRVDFVECRSSDTGWISTDGRRQPDRQTKPGKFFMQLEIPMGTLGLLINKKIL